ncbi:MAG TPA: HAMP domain-containing histidine kinase [Mariprofundaceae bacterium]|nr:HAMP domain-containing histidine kinase [Mariprofundaceae bacterium]
MGTLKFYLFIDKPTSSSPCFALTYQGGNHSIMPIVLEDKHPISTYHLQRLLLFRSSMIVAEILLLTIATRLSDAPLPLSQIMLIITAYALFHMITWIKRPQTNTISPNYLFAQLGVDVLALTLMLYYTGGSNNPFVSLFLLPLLLVAAILPKPYIWSMAVITTISYATLLLLPFEQQTHDMSHMAGMAMQHSSSAMNTHAMGMAASFLFSVVVILFFVVSMAESLRDRERKLANAHEKSLRDEHVIALGTLAAGAAHELGTPLGTMAILTKEMESEYADDAELLEQIQILRAQVDRCKSTISQMSSSAGQLRATGGKNMVITDYISSIGKHWQSEHALTQLETHYPEGRDAPELVVDDTLQQALMSLLNNASDAGAQYIQLNLDWDDTHLNITICDDGEGLSAEVQSTLGKPFISTKADGQGLGFYLAQAVISRMGGNIQIKNQTSGKGACVDIQLPLQNMRTSHA